ncbi:MULTISPECIES: GNAT family N-acetyltransferase [unclassified Enterococcus]|uniref:GNAT family N-acetyltransferase n=1 Tax=unclassified Enterococcus TaxID=2608891 RepID=UPI001557E4DC|nr:MULTISPECIES: GNAT family N-acetyltransferase [unclassified Enterococcus]MBS7577448.1 GNAT family N-acetyltransferase [Enterococcus sp. MMGLQ5-2]MBS7584855.1 GNAT family N-acetyltransferase [Enterococcus sp. MMGLQ5-1]NPD12710.1 GNAT family N-acetyltransferase [Enterococcus sp. MMGLQ5-1]NPD37282.1 GNAT family N-acetyltransferase [Enterococcus sp. MMGLQ5-2]
MSIIVESAGRKDLSEILLILNRAKRLLEASGSPQWSEDDSPTKESISKALDKNNIYILKINEKIVGTAILTNEPEPAYELIKYGSWDKLERNYYSIHRFAIDPLESGKGYAKLFFSLLTVIAKEKGAIDIRVDTHPINKAMQKVILNNGYCFKGIINLPIKNGERFAYEKVLGE